MRIRALAGLFARVRPLAAARIVQTPRIAVQTTARHVRSRQLTTNSISTAASISHQPTLKAKELNKKDYSELIGIYKNAPSSVIEYTMNNFSLLTDEAIVASIMCNSECARAFLAYIVKNNDIIFLNRLAKKYDFMQHNLIRHCNALQIEPFENFISKNIKYANHQIIESLLFRNKKFCNKYARMIIMDDDEKDVSMLHAAWRKSFFPCMLDNLTPENYKLFIQFLSENMSMIRTDIIKDMAMKDKTMANQFINSVIDKNDIAELNCSVYGLWCLLKNISSENENRLVDFLIGNISGVRLELIRDCLYCSSLFREKLVDHMLTNKFIIKNAPPDTFMNMFKDTTRKEELEALYVEKLSELADYDLFQLIACCSESFVKGCANALLCLDDPAKVKDNQMKALIIAKYLKTKDSEKFLSGYVGHVVYEAMQRQYPHTFHLRSSLQI
ncbi:MAG: hypothetical protein Hyperionvirus3_138 [Hyperionvirus sp.]|uniref:Uncharacterized protein n=1 Tax=Hyperionvirus sp. TaxID=2487770 RepID=A0A3G5A7H3_9VIRU|nr:MAG: hypothetical protein Hyperionvirus3_138 [Hyperionvirus sp.]